MVVSPSIAKTRSHERIDGIGASPVQRFDRSCTIVPIAGPAARPTGSRVGAAILNQMRPSLSRRGSVTGAAAQRAKVFRPARLPQPMGYWDNGRWQTWGLWWTTEFGGSSLRHSTARAQVLQRCTQSRVSARSRSGCSKGR